MAGPPPTFVLLMVLCVSTLMPPGASAGPLNWDKITLTESQETTIRRVDDLLNDFLTQLVQEYRERNPQVKGIGQKKINVWNKGKGSGNGILEAATDIVEPQEDESVVGGSVVEVPAEKTETLTDEAMPSKGGPAAPPGHGTNSGNQAIKFPRN